MHYDFKVIEQKWKKKWSETSPFKAENHSEKPKYYVLDMFPYPSGAGLHVGHPLGYIASDIIARYKRHKGFNVLHPMGYDSFGLPAEQYAIQTGQHPAVTTETNAKRYRKQLDDIGFSFDWSREVKTSDPSYYRWTQWIFIQLFNSWYNQSTDKAEPIYKLVKEFEERGNTSVMAENSFEFRFTAADWKQKSEKDKMAILQHYRLTYLSDSVVNWCPALGTVLANDEVKDGLSERGGHPVIQKKMKQWSMRITAYAERLLRDLEKLDWSESIKEQQRNWIGKSTGARIFFDIKGFSDKIEVFSTRPDTIFGASFMVLAPEHPLVLKISTPEQMQDVKSYIEKSAKRTERERMAEVKAVSGCFTGCMALHPITGKEIPIWIADYVLAGYGTGAVMAVPSGDQRDYLFATHFGLEIPVVIEGTDLEKGANESKDGKLINSDFLNDLSVTEAIKRMNSHLHKLGLGEERVNYRLRDAVFSRQRYWGEPIPVYYKDGVPHVMDSKELPLQLPEVDKYLPTEEGDPPLARAKNWKTKEGYPIETNTMPGWAGSSWYMFRYMDSGNEKNLVDPSAVAYWKNVDLYIGGSEHATGHLLYSRFWTKFLYDIGKIPVQEPFEKMINQGMIVYFSANLQVCKTKKVVWDAEEIINLRKDSESYSAINDALKKNGVELEDFRESLIPIDLVKSESGNLGDGLPKNVLIGELLEMLDEYKGYQFISSTGKLSSEGEITIRLTADKMSKSKFNVVNPDELIKRYGADTLRCYEMFLGPLEESKSWNTKGIEGVFRFLRKFWRLFHPNDDFEILEGNASQAELKVLHRTIKKVSEDIDRYSFNTVVSELMICTNELNDLKCNSRQILEPLVVLLSPYAPFMAEELWEKLGHTEGISRVKYPEYDEQYLREKVHNYPISFNGKMRFTIEMALNLSKEEIEKEVLALEETQKWLDGKAPKKVIVVPNKIVNIVV